MTGEIKIIECNGIVEAENVYLQMREENCWVVVKPLKVVWSWKKFKTVVRFSMKRVKKRPMDIFEFSQKLSEVLLQSTQAFHVISEYKKQKKLQQIIQSKQTT